MMQDEASITVTLRKDVFLDLIRFFRDHESSLTPDLSGFSRDLERTMYEFMTIEEAEDFFK